jgi:glutathione synthase/RimK-type ligase-like ATP-grasp enzyme
MQGVPRVLLLTQETLKYPDFDTSLLISALAARGIGSTAVDWRSAPDSGGDLAVIRSTWDYTQHLAQFLGTLGEIRCPLLNPPPVVRWNSHKAYLAELSAAGVPVVPTTVIRRGSPTELPANGRVVIKPAVSAGAAATERFAVGDPAAEKHLHAILATKDAVLQPFVDLSTDGERSLIYLGGRFSHAVRKMPRVGDFRVQVHHGGVERNDSPTPAELAVAERAMAAVPGGGDLLYARVDLVGPRDGPLLMELELIEPQLFLDRVNVAADRLADAIARRLA